MRENLSLLMRVNALVRHTRYSCQILIRMFEGGLLQLQTLPRTSRRIPLREPRSATS